ncbi:gamma-glutamyltransferase, partial [Mesorhizobium sp. M1A.F.Ca.IN.022.05.2.1]|uniref:gamma-glutamyltransferase n=1 Tax=Mesorhizobium sp. M1A.F.Ca.IN.022.05.2.1 TaxID=2496760 RepID=UPI001FDEB024
MPGAVDGWARAAKLFGTRTLSELLEPAATLAEQGFTATRHTVASFAVAEDALRARNSLRLWSEEGLAPRLYDTIRQPRLAYALRQIGRSDGRDFYEGAIAKAIVRAVSEAGGWID